MRLLGEVYEQLVSWGEYVLWVLFSLVGLIFSFLFLAIYFLSFIAAIALPVALFILIIVAIASLL